MSFAHTPCLHTTPLSINYLRTLGSSSRSFAGSPGRIINDFAVTTLRNDYAHIFRNMLCDVHYGSLLLNHALQHLIFPPFRNKANSTPCEIRSNKQSWGLALTIVSRFFWCVKLM